MPLTTVDDPGEIDPFGVRFTMEDGGTFVRCHIFRAAMDHMEDRAIRTDDERLARFQKARGLFESVASRMYDAGHRTPWIDIFEMAG
jgi:hypothetical protein